ncbi:MAG: DNA topoisomerase I, partial [Ignavibacteriae bacterium]
NPKQYTTKVSSAQEAHEAIRPTDFARRQAGDSDAHQRLYDLIWKRTVASQMAEARLEKTVATISVSTVPEFLTATGEVLVFDGFLKVYMESTDDDVETEDTKMLPPLAVGQELPLTHMLAQERYQRPPARYTEASLVKKLEELGIGRPSTYAPTISTIQARNYVVKEDRDGRERQIRALKMVNNTINRAVTTEITGAERSKLFPTDIGSVVTDFLVKHFDEIMDYNFTATVEKQFDEIAEGRLKWNTMIADFYAPFQEDLKRTSETAERQSGERLLGIDPKSGKNVYVRLARYGPIAQIGDADDEDKKQKGLPGKFSIETITLDEAMELFKFPRVVGDLEGKPMVVKVGRFGPYIDHDGTFASVPKEEDPLTVTAERAEELVLAKRKSVAERTIKEFPENPDVKVLKGRWGPFIQIGRVNVRIPKGTDAESLTLEQCLEFAAQQAPAPKGKGRKGETAKEPKGEKAKEQKGETAKKKAVKKAVKKVAKKAAKKTVTKK